MPLCVFSGVRTRWTAMNPSITDRGGGGWGGIAFMSLYCHLVSCCFCPFKHSYKKGCEASLSSVSLSYHEKVRKGLEVEDDGVQPQTKEGGGLDIGFSPCDNNIWCVCVCVNPSRVCV